MTLPVPADLPRLLRRLAREEGAERRELARLEARLRRFEDVERPAYDAWIRCELGPAVAEVEELAGALRARRMLAERVTELVEEGGLHPREALWAVREAAADEAPRAGGRAERATRECEEVEARRRAKRERKRAARQRMARERRAAGRKGAARGVPVGTGADGAGGGEAARRLVAVYRALARSLHPDSPCVVRALAPAQLRAVWAEVQAAYALRSLERLLALGAWLEAVAEGGLDAGAELGEGRDAPSPRPGGFLSLAERHERLRALRRAARTLDRRLGELVEEPAWAFPTATPQARRTLRQGAARRLASERDALRVALAAVDEFLDGIGPPRPPRVRRARGRR
ncbi:MAG: hypothetical protein IT294_08870 [Deltaproteobacteria bacterium]|nr:hypothetical protein [Deltaproteobacteria bacterium]